MIRITMKSGRTARIRLSMDVLEDYIRKANADCFIGDGCTAVLVGEIEMIQEEGCGTCMYGIPYDTDLIDCGSTGERHGPGYCCGGYRCGTDTRE